MKNRDFRRYLRSKYGLLWWLRHPRIYWSPSERMNFAMWIGLKAAHCALDRQRSFDA